jgi:hypothetical protein
MKIKEYIKTSCTEARRYLQNLTVSDFKFDGFDSMEPRGRYGWIAQLIPQSLQHQAQVM